MTVAKLVRTRAIDGLLASAARRDEPYQRVVDAPFAARHVEQQLLAALSDHALQTFRCDLAIETRAPSIDTWLHVAEALPELFLDQVVG